MARGSGLVERGDQYVWIALDSETKTVFSFYVGKRDAVSAYRFIGDLHNRIAETHRRQLTTDGLEGYVPAVEEHFGADVDFAQLVKKSRRRGPENLKAAVSLFMAWYNLLGRTLDDYD